LPLQRCIAGRETYGVYFILKSHRVGGDLSRHAAEYSTKDPNYLILAHQRSSLTHYFYIRVRPRLKEGLNKGWRKDEGRGGCSPATVRGDWGVLVPFWRSAPLIGRVADTLRPLAAQ
jgi:hypothetical protein